MVEMEGVRGVREREGVRGVRESEREWERARERRQEIEKQNKK